MTVFVDELRAWPGPVTGRTAIHFGNGKRSCHLTCDGPLEELHAFAAKIGMKRAWFQDHRLLPHYDLTPSRRIDALDEGAEEMPAREQLRLARKRLESKQIANATSITVNDTRVVFETPITVHSGDTITYEPEIGLKVERSAK